MATTTPVRCTARPRRILAQRQVRADLIVVRRVRRKNLSQVRLAKDQHPVQALATYGANQTPHTDFAAAIQARSVGRAVTAAQSKTRRRAPQGDAELMAEEQVLRFKSA